MGEGEGAAEEGGVAQSRERKIGSMSAGGSILREKFGYQNHYDHAGPAKIGITVSTGGQPRSYTLPVQMVVWWLGSTMYRKLVGSKTFYG